MKTEEQSSLLILSFIHSFIGVTKEQEVVALLLHACQTTAQVTAGGRRPAETNKKETKQRAKG